MFDNIPKKGSEASSAPKDLYDLKKNLDYYDSMMKKVIFIEHHEPVVSRHMGDVTCATLPYGEIGCRKGCYVLSFHQYPNEFRKELCKIINNLGYEGYLKREK